MKIVFDCSIFIHAHWNIKNSMGFTFSEQDVAKSVLRQIERIAFTKYSDRELILSLDSSTNFRKQIYPEYKGERTKRFDAEKIADYLKESGHTYVQYEGLESDDLMFLISKKYKGTILVTNDMDFLLMLDDFTAIDYYRKKQLVTMTAPQILLEQLLKVCGGCKSDSIPSIKLKKIGPATLEKMIVKGELISLKQSLDYLLEEGIISDYTRNWKLVLYRIKTYLKYVENFENLYNSL